LKNSKKNSLVLGGLKSQGRRNSKKSVFLAEGLERAYKPHYSPNKDILA
jgi:hypothetical protein